MPNAGNEGERKLSRFVLLRHSCERAVKSHNTPSVWIVFAEVWIPTVYRVGLCLFGYVS
jgi:hypothetical protein